MAQDQKKFLKKMAVCDLVGGFSQQSYKSLLLFSDTSNSDQR